MMTKNLILKYYSKQNRKNLRQTHLGDYMDHLLRVIDSNGGGGSGGDICFGDRALNIQHRLASILPIQVILPELLK